MDGREDENASGRMNDVESVGAEGCRMEGAEALMLIPVPR